MGKGLQAVLLLFGTSWGTSLKSSDGLALFPTRGNLDTLGASWLANTACRQAPSPTSYLGASLRGPPIAHDPVFSGVLQSSVVPSWNARNRVSQVSGKQLANGFPWK